MIFDSIDKLLRMTLRQGLHRLLTVHPELNARTLPRLWSSKSEQALFNKATGRNYHLKTKALAFDCSTKENNHAHHCKWCDYSS